MSTHIEWTQETWNPVSGCTRVSPGCDHCYIERAVPFRIAGRRFDGDGPGSTTGVKLHSDRVAQPLRWRKPRRVFVNSMSDLFHDDVPASFIAEVFAVMAACPQHTFQILTKRHARMRSVLSWDAFEHEVRERQTKGVRPRRGLFESWPLPNVWIGVSVENQQWADNRVPALLDTPAAVRFLSCEPLLGPVTLAPQWLVPDALVCGGNGDWTTRDSAALAEVLRAATRRFGDEYGAARPAYVDWVIVGGESGPGARPMHPQWARDLRDQCTTAAVPFFFKQWGEWQAGSALPPQHGVDHVMVADGRHEPWAGHVDEDGGPGTPLAHARYRREPGTESACAVSRVGKKAAGRELDGRTWDEYPQAVTHA